MAETLFQFPWQVSTGGYRVIKDKLKGKPQSMLTDYVPLGEPAAIKTYLPLERHTGLFRQISELALTEIAVCDFANRYGFLGESQAWVALQDKTVKVKGEPKPLAGWGEPLATWFEQISRMKRAVDLWDMTRNRDLAALEKFITWRENRVHYQYEVEGAAGGQVLRRDTDSVAFGHFRSGDIIQPAQYILQQLINDELGSRAGPILLWKTNWLRLGLYFAPTNLLGALWLQLATAIDKDAKFLKCEVCGSPFEISPQVNRKDRLTCSNACRTRAYRKRKEMRQAVKKKKRRLTAAR